MVEHDALKEVKCTGSRPMDPQPRMKEFLAGGPFRPTAECPMDEPNEVVIICPVCGYQCVHLGPVSVQQNHQVTTVDEDGARLDWKRRPGAYGRGSEINLAFSGECGHAWTIRFGFHKGTTYVTVRDIREPAAGGPVPDYPTLWRD